MGVAPIAISSQRRPPGPRGTLLRGNLAAFLRDRLDFFTNCARDYGDFVSIRLGHRRIVLVSDPASIEYALVTNTRNFIKHFALRLNPLVLGNGLLTSEGDFWLHQRRLAQPAFLKQRIAAYGPVMVEHTRRLLGGWKPGESRNIHAEIMRLTLGIAARTLFDADAGGQADEIRAALEVAHQAFTDRLQRLVRVPTFVPTPGNLRLRRAVRRLDDVIYGFIRQRRAGGADRGDLLSMLLQARDETGQGGMTDKQLRDEAMTLFLAGHETTALALSWAWYLLARHPQAEEKLAAEVKAVLGDRPATVDDLPRLPYTAMVVDEALRLYPPAFVVGREALAPLELGGYHIPAGMTLLMSQWVMHRDERFFENPEEFRPERWQNDLAKRLPRLVYFPFGAGPRRCIGDTFALMEAALVLATFAQHYRFTVLDGHEVIPSPDFTLRPTGGIPAILAPR
jgi:cytochrome P450